MTPEMFKCSQVTLRSSYLVFFISGSWVVSGLSIRRNGPLLS